MEKDPNKRHYFNAMDETECSELFTQLSNEKEEIFLWEKGQSETGDKVEKFKLISWNSEKKQFTMNYERGLLKKLIGSNLVNKEVLFKIPHDRYNYLASGELNYNSSNDTHLLSLSSPVFKSQQRRNYRLPASKFVTIQFKVDGDVFDCLDISAGGVSFLYDRENYKRFSKGRNFEKCIVRFNKTNYDIPNATVAGVWDQKDTKSGELLNVVKIGLSFELPKHSEEALFKHINAEARGEEIRKKFFGAKEFE